MANGLLSCHARPIMAQHVLELEEILSNASILLINLGTLTDDRIKTIQTACTLANKYHVPILLDPVGCGGLTFRLQFALDLIKTFKPQIIKGNMSEIASLLSNTTYCTGVDSEFIPLEKQLKQLVTLQEKFKTTVISTGKIDLVSSSVGITKIEGGSNYMSKLTATGCLSGAIIAAMQANLPLSISHTDRIFHFSSVLGLQLLKEAAKHAATRLQANESSGSFQVYLLDQLTILSPSFLKKLQTDHHLN